MGQNTIPPKFKQMTVPQRIKWLRKQAGSHDKLAARVGTTRQVVIRWEKGISKPSRASRVRLADKTGLPIACFKDGSSSDEDDEEAELVALLAGNIRALVRAELAKSKEIA